MIKLIRLPDKTEEVRRLAMGRLLDDMQRKMTEKTENGDQDPLKMLVHATHDTAIAGLRSTLDVFDDQCVKFGLVETPLTNGRWPAFTASITFELFKKKRRSSFGFSSHSDYCACPSPLVYLFVLTADDLGGYRCTCQDAERERVAPNMCCRGQTLGRSP